MAKKKEVNISSTFCTKCGNRGIPIPRKLGKTREAGHLKKMYCLFCQKEHNFVEIRPFGSYNYSDFLFEFKNGNFDENGNRKYTYGELKNIVFKKERDENGKINV